MRVLVALLVLSLLIPSATAQEHDHGVGPVQISTDLNDDGLALVGHPAHFNVIAFGDDDAPDFHQDLPVRVWHNGRVVFQTDDTAGHDYDGIQAFDIAFTEPGTWRVEALQAGEVVAHREGTVVHAAGNATLDVHLGQPVGIGGDGIVIDFAIHQDGRQVDHVDGLVEVFHGDRLVFRTHTHTHDERQRLRFVPDASGDHTVRITGYVAFPTEDGPRFTPVVHEQLVAFEREITSNTLPATTPPPEAPNAVVRGTTGPYTLLGTYDPWTQVGVDTIQRLTATVLDEAGVPLQHVDFDAHLVGPHGTVFSSSTLHEYDGSFEVATKQAELGLYELRIEASRGNWSDEIVMPYAVVPAGAGAKAGDQLFPLDAAPKAHELSRIRIDGQDVAGNPFAHGELDVDIRAPSGLPLLLTKIHTHGDGVFRFDYAPPVAGALPMRLTPFPLEASAITGYHGAAVGSPIAPHLEVAPGVSVVALPESGVDERRTPGAPIAVLVVALALVARRR